ncbi:MAG TPA: hypothetical protein VH598_07770 [Verrucomicrobiae bacterium]|jgi:chorismate-pyruvate lyase|nr:hypothetical protein [Verrucomicrobiae bacterium]
MPETSSTLAASSAKNAIVHPLDEFYALAGRPLPPLNEIEGQGVPEPYKTLLVHQNDMTPTLEQFHGHAIHLQVLSRRHTDGAYFREVVLLLDGTDQPVEFGAIKINLSRFPPPVREQILQEHLPLGHILAECKVPHASRPSAFIRLASDKFINDVLKLSGAQVLYGRRNTLFDLQNHPLAEIVEILPTAAKKPDGA